MTPELQRLRRAVTHRATLVHLGVSLAPDPEEGPSTPGEQVDLSLSLRLMKAASDEVITRGLELAQAEGRLPMPLAEALGQVERDELADEHAGHRGLPAATLLSGQICDVVLGRWGATETTRRVSDLLALWFPAPALEDELTPC